MRVLLTGGNGFLGKAIIKSFENSFGVELFYYPSSQYNLMRLEDCLAMVGRAKPDVVIHSAAIYGGLGINLEIPEEIFYTNTIMNANIIRASAMKGVKKFVGIGTACSYPGYLEGKLREDDIWRGEVHETVKCYGAVKKMMIIHCEAAKKEYGMDSVHPILANLYGPHDSYHPRRSHVVAALIRKFYEAKQIKEKKVVCWGTGSPRREFLYVEDAADVIVSLATGLVIEKAGPIFSACPTESGDIINVGTGVATSIKELAEMIADVSGFDGRIVWDTSKPDGQKLKVFDVTKLKSLLGYVPESIDKEKLKKTYDWFAGNYEWIKMRNW